MRRRVAAGILLTAIVTGVARAEPADVAKLVAPGLQQWTAGDGVLSIRDNARIVIARQDYDSLSNEASLLDADLKFVSGLLLDVKRAQNPRPGDIVLALGEISDVAGSEGYTLKIDDHVLMTARKAAGVFYGAQTLLQLLKRAEDRRTHTGEALDYPILATRAVMLDAARSDSGAGLMLCEVGYRAAASPACVVTGHIREYIFFGPL